MLELERCELKGVTHRLTWVSQIPEPLLYTLLYMGPEVGLHPELGNSNGTKMSHWLSTPGNAFRKALGKLSTHPAHSSSFGALARSPRQRKMLSGASGLGSVFARTMSAAPSVSPPCRESSRACFPRDTTIHPNRGDTGGFLLYPVSHS